MKTTKVYKGPGYPVDPKKEEQREIVNFQREIDHFVKHHIDQPESVSSIWSELIIRHRRNCGHAPKMLITSDSMFGRAVAEGWVEFELKGGFVVEGVPIKLFISDREIAITRE